MKSAYELAMERLQASEPQVSLNDAQKAKLADLDQTYQAKIAEKEVFLDGLIAQAQTDGKLEELTQLQEQRSREIQRLREKCEEEKEAVRREAAES